MSDAIQTVQLTQAADYQFDIDYGGGLPLLRADEPAPLGQGGGPTPVQLLASAVGNCLGASLLFALRKFRQQPEPISCEVSAESGRNAEGRLRVLTMTARLTLGVPDLDDPSHILAVPCTLKVMFVVMQGHDFRVGGIWANIGPQAQNFLHHWVRKLRIGA